MAKAGFEPRDSIKLWESIREDSRGKSPIEFMSYHFSNDRRIMDLQGKMTQTIFLFENAMSIGKGPSYYLVIDITKINRIYGKN